MDTKQVLEMIETERNYQKEKWGNNSHTNEEWSVIANEEAGEVARAILDLWRNPSNKSSQLELLQELVQQATVLAAWIEDYGNKGLNFTVDATQYTNLRKIQIAALINKRIGRNVANPNS